MHTTENNKDTPLYKGATKLPIIIILNC